MQPPKSDKCVLCGDSPATTRDHVPPRALFKGFSAEYITVPACHECNNGSSSDDEDLRFYISVQVGKQTPEAASMWEEGAHKSILRKTSLREQFIATAREVRTIDEHGNLVTRIAFLAPRRLYHSVFERTFRGLYFFHTGRIFPSGVGMVTDLLENKPDRETLMMLNQQSIGGDVCRYWFFIDPDNLDSTTWIYQIHGEQWIRVHSNLPGNDVF